MNPVLKLRRKPALRARRRGVLTVEWILLITVLVIGLIAGLGAVRDAILGELKDLADAVAALSAAPPPPPESVGPQMVTIENHP